MKHSTPPLPKRRLFARATGARRKPVAPAPQPFHAFIAYADLVAAKRAMGVIDEVIRATEGKFAFKPMLWRFDQLTAAKWCDYAISDAATANVVVLANSSRSPLPRALEDWVSTLLTRTRGQRITIVSLQGEEDAWTIAIEAPRGPAAQQQLRILPPAASGASVGTGKPMAAVAA